MFFCHAAIYVTALKETSYTSNKWPNECVGFVQGSSTKQTVYCGSKQPSQKDFALIVNHKTGEFVLERLTCKLNLKRYVK